MGFQTYCKNIQGEEYTRSILFHTEFKVPWIFCWSFKIMQDLEAPLPMSLVREFKVKWWDEFKQEICSQETVLKFLQTGEKLKWTMQQLVTVQTKEKSPLRKVAASSSIQRPNTPSKGKETEAANPAQDFFLSKMMTNLDVLQEYLNYLKEQTKEDKGISNQGPTTVGSTTAEESTSSPTQTSDPFGGPCAQDPYDY